MRHLERALHGDDQGYPSWLSQLRISTLQRHLLVIIHPESSDASEAVIGACMPTGDEDPKLSPIELRACFAAGRFAFYPFASARNPPSGVFCAVLPLFFDVPI